MGLSRVPTRSQFGFQFSFRENSNFPLGKRKKINPFDNGMMSEAVLKKKDKYKKAEIVHLLAHGVDPVLHVESEEDPVRVHGLLRGGELWALAGQVLVIGLVVTCLGLAQRHSGRRKDGRVRI